MNIRATGRMMLAIAICATLQRGLANDQPRKAISSEAKSATKDRKKPGADELRRGHHEVPGDRYVPVPRAAQPTTPALIVERDGHVSVQVNVNGAGNNIVGDAANEPSIAVDPTNPVRMAIGWRQFDSISSDFRQAGWGYTADGGHTWTFPGVIEPGVFRSDPVLGFDSDGNFYYNSLTADALNNFECKVFKSGDGGATWNSGVYAYGGDKQWMTVDRSGSIGNGNIYAYWTEFYSCCPGGHFCASYDGAQSFGSLIDVPGSPQWGTLAVGPDGELYVAGDGFIVAKSTTLKNSALPPAFDFSNTVSLDGSMSVSGGPNPGGLLGQVWIGVDHSGGPYHGNVYLLCSVSRNSTADPLDVMFARSTNGGVSWSAPVRVNDDPGTSAYQWFGTMSVAPNGRIDVVWNDTRNDPGGYMSELYYSYSTDAGVTWSTSEPLTPAFDPHVGWPQQNKIGDYYDMVSDDRGANLAFSATFNGEQDVYYMRIGEPVCPDAGEVHLDRPKYACESTMTIEVLDCGLNTDDQTIQNVTVDVASDSETTPEQVTLFESSPASAQFIGSIPVSQTNSNGVLLVTEGDTITVTYIDADDGVGGVNVPVTADAVVDCTPPVISSVQTSDIGPFSATVTLATDEPTRASVDYGANCGSLGDSATGNSYGVTPSVDLTGLTENTAYAFSVEAEDEAGNTASDDNGGSCYSFNTTDIPNYFTELFTSGNDLDNLSLIFSPDGSFEYYSGCVESITTLPTDPAGGTTLSLSDDGSATITLTGGATVDLYGVAYASMYVNANGNITFNASDSDTSETIEDHFSEPRVSALFDDLNPAAGGSVSWKQLADRVAITWQNVPEYNTSNANTFQIEMYFDGTIVLNYLAIAAQDGLAGLSAGGGVPAEFYQTDLSAMGACGPRPPQAFNVSTTTPVEVPVTILLNATDDGLPETPGMLEYVISTLPGNGALADPLGGAITAVPYTLTSNGYEVVYQPDAGFHDDDTFQYLADDGGTPPDGGESNTATVTVAVGGPAWDPVAHPVNDSTGISTAVNVTLNGTDPNGDPLVYIIESLPTSGYLSDPNGGAIDSVPYQLVASGQVVTYQPLCGATLTDAFTYSVQDATAGSNVADVNIDVTAAAPRLVYNFPLDSDPGWSAEGQWAFGQPTGGGTHSADPTSGYTGDFVYGYNLAGDYARNIPAYALTTPAVDCSNLSQVELRFRRWLGVEAYDEATVEVSNDGASWTVVWDNPGGSNVDEAAWSLQTYDISAVADGQSTVYVRWTMGPTDSSVTFPGWNIDDVEIHAIVPPIPADFNGDGLVNPLDLMKFAACLSGPDAAIDIDCLCVDLDADNDVDLGDFAEFQREAGN